MYKVIDDQHDFLLVSKFPGVSIHNESDAGLIQQLQADTAYKLWPVHRLDKATSGLLLCAKNAAAASRFSQAFQQRLVEKYYLALSDRKPNKKQGLIIGDMLRTRKGNWKLAKTQNNPALTQFFSYGLGNGCRLYLLKPHTGKTHQLRVALKSIGAGILGDSRYGIKNSVAEQLYLHAYCLRFQDDNHAYNYYCLPEWPLGADMQLAFDNVDIPWQAPWRLNWPKLTSAHSNDAY